MSKLKNAFPFLLLFTTAIVIFFPGLGAAFQFDDWPNLSGLTWVEHSTSTADFWRYVFSKVGNGGSGRPISYLSFAMQAKYWPENPKPFLIVNISIHLLNAFLVYFFCLKVSKASPSISKFFEQYQQGNPSNFALMVSLLWMVLPINISTVLYTVQRMTLLSGFFVLIGICGYLEGRAKLANKSGRITGWIIITLSVVIMGPLAFFSKENGILLVAYILAIEL